jgi:hypothetical protein
MKPRTPSVLSCGAVSLTFDDGTASQLAMAIPALNERRLRATFYLAPQGDRWEENLAPWKAVAAAGHEIGNHSLSHTGPGNLWGGPGGLEDWTLERIERDILAAQERLARFFAERPPRTFCYPCYSTFVGRGAGRRSYVPVVASNFLAGRAVGEYGFGNSPAVVDLACLAAQPTDRMSGFEMIGLAEELVARGQWLIFVFHNINGGRLSVCQSDFLMLLDHLQRRRDVLRTATVAEIAGEIDQKRRREHSQ